MPSPPASVEIKKRTLPALNKSAASTLSIRLETTEPSGSSRSSIFSSPLMKVTQPSPYFRIKATNGQEYPSGWERQAAKIRAKIMYNRVASRQEDAQDDFLDCVFDNLPRRAMVLFY